MAHGLVKATIIPEIVRLIAEKYSVGEEKALDMFYTSAVAASLDNDESGLYGQSPLYIFSLFNDEMQTISIQSELDTLKNIIANAVPVEQIYLFGSYAFGTPHKDSDLDLYVVLKDNIQMRLIDAAIQIRLAISRKKTMPVDIIANTLTGYRERAKGMTIERTIAEQGIKIYG
jgi:predicted nucleotidyltransferase